MNFLLKIVQGPNAGAEIALVEGLTISVGKTDSCDIVLADPTLPESPIQLEARADSVMLLAPGKDQQRLENFHAVSYGTTIFAVGPADEAWGEIVYPKPETAAEPEKPADSPAPAPAAEPEAKGKPPAGEGGGKRKSAGCLIAIEIVVLILLLLAVLAWFKRDAVKAYLGIGESAEEAPATQAAAEEEAKNAISALASEFGLAETNINGRTALRGDFATRAERLAATAKIYATSPGIELDLADAESLLAAVGDTLAVVGEKKLAVSSVSNRVARLEGTAFDLKRALEAIAEDVPKIENADCSAVVQLVPPREPQEPTIPDGAKPNHFGLPKFKPSADAAAEDSPAKTTLPVCGIITTPYPYLVLRDGTRVLEGGSIGGSTVLKIMADTVIITNETGRIEWKP